VFPGHRDALAGDVHREDDRVVWSNRGPGPIQHFQADRVNSGEQLARDVVGQAATIIEHPFFRKLAFLREHPEAQRHKYDAGDAYCREEQQELPGRREPAQGSGVHRWRILRNTQPDDCHEIVTRHEAQTRASWRFWALWLTTAVISDRILADL
jgi:hypothetical protein